MRYKIISHITLVISITIIIIFLNKHSTGKTDMYTDSELFNEKNTLTVNLNETPQIPWNSIDTSTNVIETFAAAVFGNLIETQEIKSSTNKYILIENYVCKEQKCRIDLNKEVKFHNGRSVTAYDFEFSLIRFLTQKREDNFAFTILNDIQGIDRIQKSKNETKNGIVYPRGILEGIEVIDNFKIVLHLKRNNPYIIEKLNTGRLPIVPIEELQIDYIHWKHLPIGFGRYKLIKADLDKSQFILENLALENIHKYIRIVFSDQDIGDIRILSHMSDSKLDGKVILPTVYVNAGFLFNFSTPLGANENFRNAISHALDRDKIAQTSLDNDLEPEDQILPSHSILQKYRAHEPLIKQNIILAKEFLNKVPKELWFDKTLHVHSFWTLKRNLNDIKYIQEIKQQLSVIGLNLVFHNTDFNYTKFKEVDENVLWWTGFDSLSNDPNRNFAYFTKGSFFRHIFPENNKEFENLLKESNNTFMEQPEATQKLSSYFKEKNYMVVILNVKKRFSYKKNRIEFIEPQPNGIRMDLWKIRLKEDNFFNRLTFEELLTKIFNLYFYKT
ncbi:ABC transporter substrate-binding protein [Fluviispira vulneris]|uniref:ABC transporter substrate-binding protein n=1 Tax=Fluviispira vulneris TaxID=2763012 RepID=UPI001C982457|nr:ABC transporter substrate-binding protein [Fluviispira vulneris]